MTNIETNKPEVVLSQLLDQQPTAYAAVLEACRALGYAVSPTTQPADLIAELPSNVLPFLNRLLELFVYGEHGSHTMTQDLYALMNQNNMYAYAPLFPKAYPVNERDFVHLPQATQAIIDRSINGFTRPDLQRLGYTEEDCDLLIKSQADNSATTPISGDFTNDTAHMFWPAGIKLRRGNGTTGNNPTLVAAKDVRFETVESTSNDYSYFGSCSALKYLSIAYVNNNWRFAFFCRNAYQLEYCKLPDLNNNSWGYENNRAFESCRKLIDLELTDGVNKDVYLNYWNPTDKGTTFLQNFKEHICQRLANRTGQSKLTLTLSAAVYTAIMTDKYIKAELLARNWKVTDGTNNYNN